MADETETTDLAEVKEGTPVNGTALALSGALVDVDSRAALAAVDRRIAFYTEVRHRSIKLTLPQDWVDTGGKPYLQGTGAERLKPIWGIYHHSLRMEPGLDEVRRRLRTGEHVSVQFTGTFGSHVTKEESEFIGGRSSDDPFFSERKGGIEEVDPEDLVKAAFTNLEVNAITRLLGLRGLTWEDLQQQGFSKDKAAARVDYRKGGETDSGGKLGGMAKEIRAGLETIYGDDAPIVLKTLSKFKGSDGSERSLSTWGELERASEKWVGSLLGKVRTEIQAWEKDGKPAPKKPLTAASTPF